MEDPNEYITYVGMPRLEPFCLDLCNKPEIPKFDKMLFFFNSIIENMFPATIAMISSISDHMKDLNCSGEVIWKLTDVFVQWITWEAGRSIS